MFRNFAATLLIALPVASAATPDALGVASSDVASSSAATTQIAKNSIDIRQAMQIVQEARTSYGAGRYSEAVESYRKALEMVPASETTAKTIDFMKLSLADALIAKAMDYRAVGRSEEAVSFLNEAIELAPDSKKAKQELGKTLDPVRTNPALTPQHQANIHEVERLLDLAYGYYNLGKFDEAEATFKSVQEIDAYNSAAQQGLKQVYARMTRANVSGREAMRAKALADVSGTFAETLNVQYDAAAPSDAAVASEVYQVPPEELALADYLSTIQIENIQFDDASIDEMLDVLRGLLRRAVAENPPSEQFGTNVVTNFGPADSEIVKAIESRRLNLKLSHVSFRELLTAICSQLGISYYHVPIGVELTCTGKDYGPLITRTFKVPPYFFAATEADSGDDSDDPFAASGSSARVKRINAVEHFKGLGINFPKDATARYNASTRSLFVRNTAYNVDLIQDLLSIEPESDKVVVLNVYLMSVDKEVLEELGFEVLLQFGLGEKVFGGGGTDQTATTQSGMPSLSGLPSVSTVTDSTAPYVSNGLRSGNQVFATNNINKLISGSKVSDFTLSNQQKSPGIFGFRGVWTAADLTVLMRGLSQKKGVDLMQNPQLIFSPNMDEQVSIAAVREMYYPISFDAPQVQQSSTLIGVNSGIVDAIASVVSSSSYGAVYATNTIVTPSHPNEFAYCGITEDQFNGVGTLVQVHKAEVLNNGQYVKLDMSAMVNEFEGFVDWGSPIYASSATDTEIVQMQITDNPILMPIFKRSYQNTSVTLASGSVVVLGGLQESMKVKYEDKVPVIGDLPIVGRLFRSSGSQNQTRALLFFAKVNIVDPTGLDLTTGKHPEEDPM
ncbi:MAG: hypothetical protein R3Y56_01350 [Akkermansia sp.]